MPKARQRAGKPQESRPSSNLNDRRTKEKADEAAAWREYQAGLEGLHEKSARLRALRLSREKSQKKKAGPE
jgi:hypothetical protein